MGTILTLIFGAISIVIIGTVVYCVVAVVGCLLCAPIEAADDIYRDWRKKQ